MELTGEQRIEASRDRVWAALNDPEVLRRSIPGCESLECTGDDAFVAAAMIKVGPVAARFSGTVTLSELDPPNGYRIEGEGQGEAAGFARGGANVRLEPDGEATVLRYTVSAQVGGKLAQIGGRLIEATARQMAAGFFERFTQAVVAPQPPAPVSAAATNVGPAARARESLALPAAVIVGFAILTWALTARIVGGAAGPWCVALAAVVVLSGAVGFLFGRRAPVIIDSQAAEAILAALDARRR